MWAPSRCSDLWSRGQGLANRALVVHAEESADYNCVLGGVLAATGGTHLDGKEPMEPSESLSLLQPEPGHIPFGFLGI